MLRFNKFGKISIPSGVKYIRSQHPIHIAKQRWQFNNLLLKLPYTSYVLGGPFSLFLFFLFLIFGLINYFFIGTSLLVWFFLPISIILVFFYYLVFFLLLICGINFGSFFIPGPALPVALVKVGLIIVLIVFFIRLLTWPLLSFGFWYWHEAWAVVLDVITLLSKGKVFLFNAYIMLKHYFRERERKKRYFLQIFVLPFKGMFILNLKFMIRCLLFFNRILRKGRKYMRNLILHIFIFGYHRMRLFYYWCLILSGFELSFSAKFYIFKIYFEGIRSYVKFKSSKTSYDFQSLMVRWNAGGVRNVYYKQLKEDFQFQKLLVQRLLKKFKVKGDFLFTVKTSSLLSYMRARIFLNCDEEQEHPYKGLFVERKMGDKLIKAPTVSKNNLNFKFIKYVDKKTAKEIKFFVESKSIIGSGSESFDFTGQEREAIRFKDFSVYDKILLQSYWKILKKRQI